MRRVLVVNYHFLPVHNVGVKQFAGYCRHLPEHGWRPVVLTKDWSAGIGEDDAGWGLSWAPELLASTGEETEIHTAPRAPYRNPLLSLHEAVKRRTEGDASPVERLALLPLRKALSLGWRHFGEYPDRFVGWVEPAVKRAAELIEAGGIDAIVSHCPPQTNHLVASRLARRFGIPWVAYFGDLFGFYVGPGDWHGEGWRRAAALRQNRRWLAPASRGLAVSPRMARLLEELYDLPSDVVVVGYDPDDFPPTERAPSDRLRVSHVGSIYPGDQRPEALLDALDELLRRHPEAGGRLDVRLVGSKCEPWLEGILAGRPCAAVVSVIPKVPPAEAVRLQRESDVLLLFNLTAEQGREGTLSYPSKVFEYLAAGRPILAIPGDGDWVDSLLERTGAGRVADTGPEAAAILEQWYLAWRDAGAVPYEGREEEVAVFSHRRQAERMAHALDLATPPRNG